MKQPYSQVFTRGLFVLLLLLAGVGCRQSTPGNHSQPPSADDPHQHSVTPVEIPGIDGLILNPLSFQPNKLESGRAAEVIVSCIVSSESGWLPEQLILWQVDERGVELQPIGQMMDDGEEPDLVAGDAVYTLSFYSVGNAGGLHYRALATDAGKTSHSPIGHLPIQPAATDSEPDNSDIVIVDPSSGTKMLANQLLLALKKETTPARRGQILQSISAEIIADIPGGVLRGVLQLRIPGEATSATVLQAVQQLQKYPETIYAEPNFVDEVDELDEVPSDRSP